MRAPGWGQGAGQACQRQVATDLKPHVSQHCSSGWGTLPKDLHAGLDAELLVFSICLKLLSLPDKFLPSLQIFTRNSHIKTQVLSLEQSDNQTLNKARDYRFERVLKKGLKRRSVNTFLCQPLMQTQPWSLVTRSGSCLLDLSPSYIKSGEMERILNAMARCQHHSPPVVFSMELNGSNGLWTAAFPLV